LQEALPGVMFTSLPPLHLIPSKDHVPSPEKYQCPLYKTAARAGALNTTGQSTNFVVHICLPIMPSSTPEFWIRQGVAALCALND
jgi:dynein heavy chain, axonemal